jgi:hypothetical protein
LLSTCELSIDGVDIGASDARARRPLVRRRRRSGLDLWRQLSRHLWIVSEERRPVVGAEKTGAGRQRRVLIKAHERH